MATIDPGNENFKVDYTDAELYEGLTQEEILEIRKQRITFEELQEVLDKDEFTNYLCWQYRQIIAYRNLTCSLLLKDPFDAGLDFETSDDVQTWDIINQVRP